MSTHRNPFTNVTTKEKLSTKLKLAPTVIRKKELEHKRSFLEMSLNRIARNLKY